MIEERNTPIPKSRDFPVILLEDSPPNSTVFVLGATGCGKTTLIANLLLYRAEKGERILILDTRDEYNLKFFGSRAVGVSNISDLTRALNHKIQVIIFSFSESTNSEETSSRALTVVYQFQRQNYKVLPPITVALDELNRFIDSHSSEASIENITQRGRYYHIKKVFGAQWFNSIPTWMRDSITEIYAYSHRDPNGLQMLEQYGFDSEDLRSLPMHTVLHYAKGEVEQIKLTPR